MTIVAPTAGQKIREQFLEDLVAAVNGMTLLDPQVYTSNDTWAKVTNALRGWSRVWGGGGAGGGSYDVDNTSDRCSMGAGGGAGGYSELWFLAADVTATVTVTIGAGGAGVDEAAGNSGGTTSFGAYHQATGGGGGGVRIVNSATCYGLGGAVGGVGSGGDINAYGATGGHCMGGSLLGVSGTGGSSMIGGGGLPRAPSSTGYTANGNPAYAYASGGGGAYSNRNTDGKAGGDGSDGLCAVVVF